MFGELIATMRAAIEAGPQVSTAVITKLYPTRSHTGAAQGGMAAALAERDRQRFGALGVRLLAPEQALQALGVGLAIDDFGGKVLGKPIELLSADHQNKADIASNIARQWYDTEQVDAIMELTTSSVALAVQALSAEKKKIDLVATELQKFAKEATTQADAQDKRSENDNG